MQRPIDLSIIIINWNSREYVRECVASVLRETRETNLEIIVVDNDSKDGCGEMLRQEHPQVIYVQCETNLGFPLANNLGATYATGQFLLFLNPDTVVLDRALDRLHKDIRELPDAGAVGCRLLNSDGSLQTSCVQAFPTLINQLATTDVFRRLFPKCRLWGMSALFEEGNIPRPVEMISGACLMIRRDVFDQLGGFCCDYFMYAEDLDLCFNAQHAGLINYYLPGARVVHHGGGSSGQVKSSFSHVTMRKSMNRFLQKHRGGLYAGCYRSIVAMTAAARLLVLGVVFPAGWLLRKRARLRIQVQKWYAVLRWALGVGRWGHPGVQLRDLQTARQLVSHVWNYRQA